MQIDRIDHIGEIFTPNIGCYDCNLYVRFFNGSWYKLSLDGLYWRKGKVTSETKVTNKDAKTLEELYQANKLTVKQLENKHAKLWLKACKHDNIPHDSPSVLFSKKNPYAKDYGFFTRCLIHKVNKPEKILQRS